MSDIRVLLVDDSQEFLQATSRFLSSAPGISVVGEFLSAVNALEEAEGLQPDLVLMDLAMPGINGLEATRRIKEKAEAPRVVLVTMHDNNEYRSAAKAASADGFITKAELVADLLPLIYSLFKPQAIPERKASRA
ncbi:MAG: DNA-binding response regulator [Chloroflexota bacterium]|nr:MAG: DNA-binding response regulator [Chloroflexota bacterium]